MRGVAGGQEPEENGNGPRKGRGEVRFHECVVDAASILAILFSYLEMSALLLRV